VLGGDRDAVGIAVALGEAGVLDQPRRARLDLPVGLAERGRAVRQRRRGEDRVGEERAGAEGVGVGGVQDHALAPAQRQHGLADVAQGRRVTDRPGQLDVADRARDAAGVQRERHAQDDERARLALEAAGAIGEVALLGRQVDDLAAAAVQRPDRDDGVAHLLAVGADVLDRRRPDRAGNAREALDPGQALGDRVRDEPVPRLAGRDVQDVAVALDPAREDPDDRAREAGVADHDVRPAREQQHVVADGGQQLVVGAGLDQTAGGAAEAQRRVIRQGQRL
jgi:hypothetical protein